MEGVRVQISDPAPKCVKAIKGASIWLPLQWRILIVFIRGPTTQNYIQCKYFFYPQTCISWVKNQRGFMDNTCRAMLFYTI